MKKLLLTANLRKRADSNKLFLYFYSMKSVFKILRYILPYKILIVVVVGFNILSVIFSLTSIAMVIPFLELLFNKTNQVVTEPSLSLSASSIKEYLNYYLSHIIINDGKMQALLFICILVIVSFLFRNLFRYLALYSMAAIRNNILFDIRNDIYKKILILPLSFFIDNKKGDIMSRISNDVQEVEWSISSSLIMFFRDPISIMAYVVSLFFISPILTIVVLILLPTTGFIINKIGRRLKSESLTVQKRMGYIISVIEETIVGLRVIKAFNVIDIANRKFKKINKTYTLRLMGVYRRRDLSAPLSEMLSIVAVVIILMIGGMLVISGNKEMSAETFITYIVLFSQLIPPIQSFTGAYSNILKGSASAIRVMEITESEEVITEKPDAKPIKKFEQSIEFRNVSFAYNKEIILNNINYTINKGKTIAVVGPSGAGKTTIAELILRFYDTTKGDILIDGISIKDYIISDVRNLIGYVTQEPVLFNDTVINNIGLGIEGNEVEESKVITASKIANAHEFITILENGYHSNIGDDGSKLSGGQKQRLCIARAVLKNPPILIFDEATSAQNTESEMLIQQSMQQIMKDRTTLIIAHKLSTIRNADEIIVIDNGEITERGTHDELITKNGTYKRLHDLQTYG